MGLSGRDKSMMHTVNHPDNCCLVGDDCWSVLNRSVIYRPEICNDCEFNKSPEEKRTMRYYKMTLMFGNQPQGSCVQNEGDTLEMLQLGELSENDSYIIEAVDLTEKQFESLPEFNGF